MKYDCQITANQLVRFSDPLTPEKRSQLIDELATWNFKPHNLHEDDLYRIACLVFEGILNIEGLAELNLQQGMFLLDDPSVILTVPA